VLAAVSLRQRAGRRPLLYVPAVAVASGAQRNTATRRAWQQTTWVACWRPS